MPTRLIDFDALWSSDKLFSCAVWARREYSWLYGLADAHGSFELTNLRVIHGRVAPIREDLSLESLTNVFGEFNTHGLLFIWEQAGKRYGYWTNCESRLPSKAHRDRYARTIPPPPEKELQEYLGKFLRSSGPTPDVSGQIPDASGNVPQGLGLGLGLGLGKENHSVEPSAPVGGVSETNRHQQDFEEFWQLYPHKPVDRRGPKQRALKKWRKVKAGEVPAILQGLRLAVQSEKWQKDGGQYVPYAATFLEDRYWEDGSAAAAAPSAALVINVPRLTPRDIQMPDRRALSAAQGVPS